MAKVVATLKKRDKRRPMAYVDKTGNVKHFSPRRKKKRFHTILAKKVVGKEALKRRKQAKTILYVKGKKVYETKSGLGKRRKKRGRKKIRRKKTGRKAKSKRCPTFRTTGRVGAAKACISRGKGRTAASKKVFNACVRRLRKSKAGRSWLRKKKIKMAKVKGKRVRRKRKRR